MPIHAVLWSCEQTRGRQTQVKALAAQTSDAFIMTLIYRPTLLLFSWPFTASLLIISCHFISKSDDKSLSDRTNRWILTNNCSPETGHNVKIPVSNQDAQLLKLQNKLDNDKQHGGVRIMLYRAWPCLWEVLMLRYWEVVECSRCVDQCRRNAALTNLRCQLTSCRHLTAQWHSKTANNISKLTVHILSEAVAVSYTHLTLPTIYSV